MAVFYPVVATTDGNASCWRSDGGVSGAPLRSAAAEKPLVRAGADDADSGRCDPRDRGTIVSITSCAVRQWRIMAAADGTAPEQFYYCRVSRREQSLRPRHTTVA